MIKMFSVKMYDEAISNAIAVLKSGFVGEGPVVKKLQNYFFNISGTNFNLPLNSGTSALHIAMILSGVKSGDEVITTPQTMAATSHSIMMAGGIPVFADIQYNTGNIDPISIRYNITKKTKAIAVVHWGGLPCDMDEILEIAAEHGLPVIEDAAHAIGAEYRGKKIGSLSDFTCFSFQAVKHVSGGDGGMISLKTDSKFNLAKRLRWFGIDRDGRIPHILGEPDNDIKELGYKYNMNDITAAIVMGNIIHLQEMLDHRDKIANVYRSLLKNVDGVKLFGDFNDRKSSNWLFSMHIEKRKEFCAKMKSLGFESSIVHARIDKNSLYRRKTDLENTRKFSESHISIPIHNVMSIDDATFISESIRGGW